MTRELAAALEAWRTHWFEFGALWLHPAVPVPSTQGSDKTQDFPGPVRRSIWRSPRSIGGARQSLVLEERGPCCTVQRVLGPGEAVPSRQITHYSLVLSFQAYDLYKRFWPPMALNFSHDLNTQFWGAVGAQKGVYDSLSFQS